MISKRKCDLLNELHEKNEQLIHDASVLIQADKDYRIENEQLKEILKDIVQQLDATIGKKESLYSVTVIINHSMFRKIKEICK